MLMMKVFLLLKEMTGSSWSLVERDDDSSCEYSRVEEGQSVFARMKLFFRVPLFLCSFVLENVVVLLIFSVVVVVMVKTHSMREFLRVVVVVGPN